MSATLKTHAILGTAPPFHEDIMADPTHQLPFRRSLVRFISSCPPIERHLMAGKAMTDIERDLIYNTVLILQASLEVWQRKNRRSLSKPSRRDH
jgi:hypothetical protein